MKQQDYALKKERHVVYRPAGQRKLFMNPDADEARRFFQKKSRRLVDKTGTLADAVSRFVHDGDYIACGGFGTSRISTAVIHEIMRQHKKELGFSAHSATHDFQLLVNGRCINRCDVAYIVGLEARGISRRGRKAIEEGEVELTEWTNAALSWRYRAASMGISFIPARCMMGTDTLTYSAAVEMECPFTEQKYVALPALYPDVGTIHVHRADIYGNCQIDGLLVSDWEMARAARRLIITTEKLISNEDIRREPQRTVIPYYLVDAVVEVPYGSYPANMPYEYYSDEKHLQEWLRAEQDPDTLVQFLERNIYGVKDFWEYLDINGGLVRLDELRRQESFLEK